ncbi:MAG: hypothetical protein Cons2KO_19120 [Congregibacter sp.]
MLDYAKQQATNFIKTLIEHLLAEQQLVNNPLMVNFVAEFLASEVDLGNVRNPSHFTRFCFDLFSSQCLSVDRIKWQEEATGLKQFSRLLQLYETGLPGYDTKSAKDILQTVNELSAIDEDLPSTGMDVTQHFLISSSFGHKGKVLFHAARFFRPARCVEIGTAYGMSAMFLMQALSRFSRDGRLWTIEAADTQFRISSELLKKRHGDQITCLHGMSDACLPQVTDTTGAIDFYFHDGGHNYDNIVRNFEQVKPVLSSGALVIIDDIRWWDRTLAKDDPRCYEAWLKIANDPSVACAAEVNDSVGIALVR